jgi:cupin superfamily acireductone dioxygenase involved in methionine salvage
VFGKTGWVFRDSNNNLNKVLMEPGDAIFIPKGLEHTVYAFEKRATLTLMMEK